MNAGGKGRPPSGRIPSGGRGESEALRWGGSSLATDREWAANRIRNHFAALKLYRKAEEGAGAKDGAEAEPAEKEADQVADQDRWRAGVRGPRGPRCGRRQSTGKAMLKRAHWFQTRSRSLPNTYA